MKQLSRHFVNKRKSLKRFNHDDRRTKRPNVLRPLMRGGIRF